MSKDKFEIPEDLQSNLVPEVLEAEDEIQFSCHKGISCYNECCKHADVTLTPYDIVRLKNRLGMTAQAFLKKHAVPFEMDGAGMPGLKLKTQDEKPVCLFVNDEGCSVYEDRPSACRYYPVGLMNMRAKGSANQEQHYFLVKEDHCMGHCEDNKMTIGQYRQEQQVEEYDDVNREWYDVILKKRSSGPTVGRPSQRSYQLFFMASYDMDNFREFVFSDGFQAVYDLDAEILETLKTDDKALVKFGARFLNQVLFGEKRIPMKQDAVERRMEQRRERDQKARDDMMDNYAATYDAPLD